MKYSRHIHIRSWLKYLRNFLINSFTNIRVPYSAQIEITLKCNAQCPFCTFPLLSNGLKKEEMTTIQVKKLINQIADLGINALSFTGGEPTLRHDLPELIHYSGVKNDLLTGIATNGYLMPSILKRNRNLPGLDYILISLDYPTKEQHDNLRGIKVFDRVIETIKCAHKEGIKVIVSTVVMNDNLHLLEDMCILAQSLNASIELFPCEDIVRKFQNQLFSIQQIEQIIPNIQAWSNIIHYLRKHYKNVLTDPVSIEIINRGGFGGFPNFHQGIMRCHVVEAYLFIRFDGCIDFPCKIYPLLSIDATQHSLAHILRSKQVMELRDLHDEHEFCDGCRLGCAIASSLTTDWKSLYAKYVTGFLRGNLK
jgi:MoaA/NifB/PqqE/SkfB family radical SAM enzyme